MPCSLALVGEAGTGRTTLWRHGLEACRGRGALVLRSRPGEDDRQHDGQGLRDLFGPGSAGEVPCGGASFLDPDLADADRASRALDHLRDLSRNQPVVLAIDDLPWLDQLTVRTLRFGLRRLEDQRVGLLATARTWSPLAPSGGSALPDLGVDLHVLPVGPLEPEVLRRIVLAAAPGTSPDAATRITAQAQGNPLLAMELARSGTEGLLRAAPESLLSALVARVHGLPPTALRLTRLLALAGPSPLAVLSHAVGLPEHCLDADLRAALAAGALVLDGGAVLCLSHPLIATAALDGLTPLDRRVLHADLSEAVQDPDARAVHRARACTVPDASVAGEAERAAQHLARRGAPLPAAEALADSIRLTPPEDGETRSRRVLARMVQCASAGDLAAAGELARGLLDGLGPGALRAEVVTNRVEVDFADAERYLRETLAGLADLEGEGPALLRGRLLGLLGWLLALQMGRIAEGLEHARAGLTVGRAHHDQALTAQAAATVATASLMLGRREDGLIEEAVRLDSPAVERHLVMWPRVLLGRQLLWDGRLAQARVHHQAMFERAVQRGCRVQLSYRSHDLARVELAAGNLPLAARHVEAGLEAAHRSGDPEATVWLAYPAGMLAALRGDREQVAAASAELDHWAVRAGQRPRSAMAAHLRGVLAASSGEWGAALAHHRCALEVLDDLGVQHPGVLPVLPEAVQLAYLTGDRALLETFVARLERQGAALQAPWVEAQTLAGRGHLQLLAEDPAALDRLAQAHALLESQGYHLDAARLACSLATAGLRWGQRTRVRSALQDAVDLFHRHGVTGWEAMADGLSARVRGHRGGEGLTTTEWQVARLVAEGHRNREIAAQLFVSESTVEAHLTRIYRRLGIRNRAELGHIVRHPTAGSGSGADT